MNRRKEAKSASCFTEKLWNKAKKNRLLNNLDKVLGEGNVPDSTAQAIDTLLYSYQLHNPQKKIAIIRRGGQNHTITLEDVVYQTAP